MSAHCYYDLKVEIVYGRGKKVVSSCEWEDNDYMGALRHPEIKEKLAKVSNGIELIQAIEKSYKDEENRLTSIDSLRESSLDWSGDEISLVNDFGNVIQIVLTEEMHDLFGGMKTKTKSIKITNVLNSNLKKQISKKSHVKKAINNEGTENVTIKMFGGGIIVERLMVDSERKKIYSRTCGDISKVFAHAIKITATPAQMEYALSSCTANVQRLVATRYLTTQLEVPNEIKGEIDKIIKKHRKKVLENLVEKKHIEGIKYLLSICRNIKSQEISELIVMSKQLGSNEITECLYDYLNNLEKQK